MIGKLKLRYARGDAPATTTTAATAATRATSTAHLLAPLPPQFTSKLEGMVTDMNLSSDMQTAFSEHIRDKEVKLDTDLTVQVLTTGFWPTAVT